MNLLVNRGGLGERYLFFNMIKIKQIADTLGRSFYNWDSSSSSIVAGCLLHTISPYMRKDSELEIWWMNHKRGIGFSKASCLIAQ